MTDTFPAPLVAFVDTFNRGAFWESHEVLEPAWRAGRSTFYHGLILLASAHVHGEHANRHGVEAQCAKALPRLTPFRPVWLGLDVDALVRHLDTCRSRAAAAGRWPGLPALTLTLDARRLRGTEPELAG
ncbi:MAG: DUF309 domain-containing protein [Gemmatimonadota bacterium]